MNLRPVLATVLLLCAGAAEAKKSVRPDAIPQLQKDGKVAPFDTLNAAALARHPGGKITSTKISTHSGRYDYKVRLNDASGARWNLRLDAGSAQILSDKKAPPAPPLEPAVPPPAH